MAARRWRWRGALRPGVRRPGRVLLLPCLAVAAGGSLVTITSGPAEGETATSNTATFSFQSGTAATFQCTPRRRSRRELRQRADHLHGARERPAHVRGGRRRRLGTTSSSGSEARHWTVAVAPVATITEAPPDPSESSDATFSFVSDQEGSTFECSLDGSSTETCTSPIAYHRLDVGSHSFAVRAVVDSVGTGAPAEYSLGSSPRRRRGRSRRPSSPGRRTPRRVRMRPSASPPTWPGRRSSAPSTASLRRAARLP